MTMSKAVFLAACLSVGQAHTKKEVELVLAHFNENVSWSDPYASVRTIYCKGKPVPGCVPLENVGREGHTYLHHIVNNYENLADWTVFSQAGAPDQGYLGHRLGGGHMQPGVQFQDYLEAAPGRDEFFVFTGALQLSSLAHAMRSSYNDKQAKDAPAATMCPGNSAVDQWRRLDLPPWFLSMMAQKCGVQEGGLQAQVAQYWKDYIKAEMPETDTVFFSQGARFAVSKDRIRQRPLEEYESLLRRVEGDIDPCANYMNEWLWYYIVGKPQQSPCAVEDVVFDAPLSASTRFLSGDEDDDNDTNTTDPPPSAAFGGAPAPLLVLAALLRAAA